MHPSDTDLSDITVLYSEKPLVSFLFYRDMISKDIASYFYSSKGPGRFRPLFSS